MCVLSVGMALRRSTGTPLRTPAVQKTQRPCSSTSTSSLHPIKRTQPTGTHRRQSTLPVSPFVCGGLGLNPAPPLLLPNSNAVSTAKPFFCTHKRPKNIIIFELKIGVDCVVRATADLDSGVMLYRHDDKIASRGCTTKLNNLFILLLDSHAWSKGSNGKFELQLQRLPEGIEDGDVPHIVVAKLQAEEARLEATRFRRGFNTWRERFYPFSVQLITEDSDLDLCVIFVEEGFPNICLEGTTSLNPPHDWKIRVDVDHTSVDRDKIEKILVDYQGELEKILFESQDLNQYCFIENELVTWELTKANRFELQCDFREFNFPDNLKAALVEVRSEDH